MSSSLVLVLSGFEDEDAAWDYFDALGEKGLRVQLVNDNNTLRLTDLVEAF